MAQVICQPQVLRDRRLVDMFSKRKRFAQTPISVPSRHLRFSQRMMVHCTYLTPLMNFKTPKPKFGVRSSVGS